MDIAQLGIAMDTSGLQQGETALGRIVQSANAAADSMDKASDSAKKWTESVGSMSVGATAFAQQARGVTDSQTQMLAALGQINTSITALGSQLDGLVNGFSQMSQAQKDAAQASQILASGQNATAASTSALADSATKASGANNTLTQSSIAVSDAQAKMRESVAASSEAVSAASDRMIASLDKQIALFGASSEQIAHYNGVMAGMTEAELEYYKAQTLRLDAMKAEAAQSAASVATQDALSASQERFISSLKQQVETIGLSGAELTAYKAAQLGVSEQAAPLIAALEAQAKAMQDAGQAAAAKGETDAEAAARIKDMVARSLEEQAAINAAASAADSAAASTAALGNATQQAATAAQAAAQGASKLASQYSGLNVATAESIAAEQNRNQVAQSRIAALQREYDLLGASKAEIEAYTADEKKFTDAQKQSVTALAAKIDAWKQSTAAQAQAEKEADSFLTKLEQETAAIGKTRTELLQMQAAQLGVSQQAAPLISQIEGAAKSTKGFSLASAGASRELIVLAHEMSQGNFSRFGGSMMVMAERTNALGAIMSPTGLAIGGVVAALALFATAAYQGAQQSAELQKSLVLTGNYAGLTEQSFNQMAESIAKASDTGILTARHALQDMVSSGKVTGDALQTLSEVTVQWAELSGKKLDDVAKDVDKMPDHVAKWAEEHNKSMHFMTQAELEYVKQLEDTGNKQEAMLTVGKAMLKAFSDDGVQHLNLLGRAFHTLSEDMQGFWNVFQQVGRSTTTAQQIAALETKKKTSSLPNWSDAVFSQQNVFSQDDQKQLDALYKKQADDAAAAKAKADEAARQQALGTANNYLTNGSHMTQAEQLKKQLAEEDAAYKAAIAGAQGNQALMEQIESAHNDRMEALETKHQKKAKDNTQNFLSGQLTDLDGQRRLIEQGLTNHLANMSKQHSAGRISDQSFIDQEYQLRSGALQKELAIATQEETIAEGKKQLSAAEKYKALMAEIKQKIAENEQNHVDAIADMQAKSDKAFLDSIDKQIDAAAKRDQSLQDQIATFGMTKDAIDQLKIAQADEAVATMEADRAQRLRNDDMADTKAIDLRINREKELAATLRGVANDQVTLDDKNQVKKQQDDLVKTWQGTIDGIGTDFHNGFLQMLTNGKNGWASFTSSLKNTFETTVVDELYKAFAKKWVINVVANIAGIAGGSGIQQQILANNGMAGSGVEGGLNNLSSGYSALTKGYGYVSGLFGAGYGSAGSAIGGAAGAFGASSAGAFGALSTTGGAAAAAAGDAALSGSAALGGLYGGTTAGVGAASAAAGGAAASTAGAGAAAGGMSATSAIPVIGWIMAGMALDSRMMAQGWNPDNGSMSGTGKVLGSATLGSYNLLKGIGVSDSIANILTGASTFSRLFGRKDPTVTSSGIDGTVTVANGFQGQDYTDWNAKGGIFRSDANGTVNTPATQAQTDMIGATIAGTVGTINQLSDAIGGVDGLQGKLSQFQYSIRNDWSNQGNITKSLTDLSNSLVDAVVPLDKYQQTGESLTQTAVRLTGVFTSTNTLADMLGKTMTQAFGAVGMAGADVRLNLVAAAGGIANFNTEVSAYFKAYYSGAEQISSAQDQMRQSFASLGLALPQSKDAFRAVVSSLDLTTAAGQNTFAALMALAPAFDQMTQSMKQAADAQQALWNQYFSAIYTPAQQAAMSTKQLQDQFNALGVAMPKTNADFQALVENMNTSTQPAKDLQNALLALAPSFAQITSTATQAAQANVQTALGNVQTAYNAQSQAINANITSIGNFITSLTSLKQSLSLGSLSTLSPQDKYLAEKQLFESTSASAAAGDATAQGNLPQIAQNFLTASQAYNASSQAYVDDYNAVQATLDRNIATAQQQLSAAQQQLSALNQMVSGILNLNATTQTVAQALNAYFAAQTAAGQTPSGSTGSLGSGLGYTQANGVVDFGSTGGSTIQSGGGLTMTGLSDSQLTSIGKQVGGWDSSNLAVQQALQAAGLSAGNMGMGAYNNALYAAENAYGSGSSLSDAVAAAKGVNGSHAGGADYIPFDGYRAELHKGEAVVTSANNQKLSQMLSIDWSRYGSGDQTALLNEIKALRAEVAASRQDSQHIAAVTLQQGQQQHAESQAVRTRQARQLQTVGDNTGRIAAKK